MSIDTFTQSVADGTERRTFLRRVSIAAAGIVGGLMGISADANAHYNHYHGCHLCRSSTGGCPGGGCNWCWWGDCHYSNGSWHTNLCCERYSNFPSCTGGCNSYVVCSYLGGTGGC